MKFHLALLLEVSFFTTNYTNGHEMSSPINCVITQRQHVLSANDTNAVRMIGWLKGFVKFVIARAILRVIHAVVYVYRKKSTCTVVVLHKGAY